MKIVTLTRMAYTDQGTFGLLRVGDLVLYTIERPWKDNEPNKSCIPCGTYLMHKGDFKGQYDNYELEDVPGRFAIEIHKGNVMADIKGCIATGTKQGVVNGKWAVLNSSNAHDTFMLGMNAERQAMIVVVNFAGGMI